MNITILCVGKIKERFFTQAIEEYCKRLSRYCNLNIIELKDEKTPDGASKAECEDIKIREGDRILSAIKDNSYVVTLEIGGVQLDSLELSKQIEKLGISGNSNIVFVIGGSLGLSKVVSERADFKLSFSKLTFPHQLMRVILLEQIYRAFKIQKNEPYHK